MCGIAGVFGSAWGLAELESIVGSQNHRGPDSSSVYVDEAHGRGFAGLGHNRLSIIDLSAAGNQPMADPEGRFWIAFNGEIYNYRELRHELREYPFRSQTDTEVILAAYLRWGEACLDRFVGMFSFLLWDQRDGTLFAARDRFGKKPLYYHQGADGSIMLASEIRALHAAGVPAEPDPVAWSTYLAHGLHDHSARTFWSGITPLPAGHLLRWRQGRPEVECWYDLGTRMAGIELDDRPLAAVEDELVGLLDLSVKQRLRSDVPVGINLSGGLDSSLLLGLVHRAQGPNSDVTAFTFATGDDRYDELPWAEQMLAETRHPWEVCRLRPEEVPELAASVQEHQSEPVGGLPTLAYAKVFERARELGVIVLLDGQGLDEQWAGYDYYQAADAGTAGIVQGTTTSPVRADCLTWDFAALARPLRAPEPFPDPLRNVQYRDVHLTKLPRALRFNDRISMRASTELRSPFLDHRLFELAFRQPAELKIRDGIRKWLPRRVAGVVTPSGLVEAPKRPLQTPQREWLRGPLRDWTEGCMETALDAYGGTWLRPDAVRDAWKDYCSGSVDNSYFVWQWVSLGLTAQERPVVSPSAATAPDRGAMGLRPA